MVTVLTFSSEVQGWKRGDPILHELFTLNVLWKVEYAYRPRDNGNRGKPHFIMEVISHAYASAEDQSLTIHKLRDIV